MPRGGTWGHRGGLGSKFFFSEIQPDLVCGVTHINGTCTSTIFLGPRPPGPLGGVKNLISEHGHLA